jgi:hypothetical protein
MPLVAGKHALVYGAGLMPGAIVRFDMDELATTDTYGHCARFQVPTGKVGTAAVAVSHKGKSSAAILVPVVAQ